MNPSQQRLQFLSDVSQPDGRPLSGPAVTNREPVFGHCRPNWRSVCLSVRVRAKGRPAGARNGNPGAPQWESRRGGAPRLGLSVSRRRAHLRGSRVSRRIVPSRAPSTEFRVGWVARESRAPVCLWPRLALQLRATTCNCAMVFVTRARSTCCSRCSCRKAVETSRWPLQPVPRQLRRAPPAAPLFQSHRRPPSAKSGRVTSCCRPPLQRFAWLVSELN